jgi:hypothetical protein
MRRCIRPERSKGLTLYPEPSVFPLSRHSRTRYVDEAEGKLATPDSHIVLNPRVQQGLWDTDIIFSPCYGDTFREYSEHVLKDTVHVEEIKMYKGYEG